MNNKILIFGKGFIGVRLQEALSCDITEKKISSIKDVEGEILKFKPKVIINCIGFTGAKNIDGCEKEKDLTLFANTYVPIVLAEAAIRHNIKLVHISSGCIYHFDYSKDKPLTEEDVPDFFELYYSRTKIYSERALEVLSRRHNILIARIRIPLDDRQHPRNILTKILGFNKVIDTANSVTYIPDFIEMLKYLIKKDARGIFNMVNSGGLKYSDLLDVYKKYRPDFKYGIMPIRKFGLVRTNLILSTKKLEKTGFKVRPIREVLNECVKNYLKY